MLKRFLAIILGRKYGLRSNDIKERPYEVIIDGETKTLFHSAFNTDWLQELGVAPETIVDLGSYDGGDAYRFKARFPSARVITVEADPTRHAIATGNLSGQDIEIANHAACGIDGDIDWYPVLSDGQADAQGSIFKHTEAYQKKFTQVEQSKVPTTVSGKRFDTFAKEMAIETVSLLHMDIEGAEHSVLQTLGPVRPRLIYLEWREGFFQGKACGPETERLLADMGYKLILQKTADRLYFRPES